MLGISPRTVWDLLQDYLKTAMESEAALRSMSKRYCLLFPWGDNIALSYSIKPLSTWQVVLCLSPGLSRLSGRLFENNRPIRAGQAEGTQSLWKSLQFTLSSRSGVESAACTRNRRRTGRDIHSISSARDTTTRARREENTAHKRFRPEYRATGHADSSKEQLNSSAATLDAGL